MQANSNEQGSISIVGKAAELLTESEMRQGIQAAQKVFEEHDATPMKCAKADKKRTLDEPLTKEEALLCVIWDMADEAAWRAATVGWLSREVDLNLAVN